jgi:hypothetical protein
MRMAAPWRGGFARKGLENQGRGLQFRPRRPPRKRRYGRGLASAAEGVRAARGEPALARLET